MSPNYTPYQDGDYGSTSCPSEATDQSLSFPDAFQNGLAAGRPIQRPVRHQRRQLHGRAGYRKHPRHCQQLHCPG